MFLTIVRKIRQREMEMKILIVGASLLSSR